MKKNPRKKVELLKQTFFPLPFQASLEDIYKYTYSQPFETEEITQQEIQCALLKPLPYKAPGLSGIPNQILHIFIQQLVSFLSRIFNACFKLGYCPAVFKESTIIVLKKPESDNLMEPWNYSEPKAY